METTKALPKQTIVKCKKCGRHICLDLFFQNDEIVGEIKKHRLCIECKYWADLIPTLDMDDVLIVEGEVIRCCPIHVEALYTPKSSYIYTASGEFLRVTDVISLGTMPLYLRRQHPNNAIFVTRKVGNLIRQTGVLYRCPRKGCLDRHQCFWFRDQDKDWNALPPDYHENYEKCPIYISKRMMYVN